MIAKQILCQRLLNFVFAATATATANCNILLQLQKNLIEFACSELTVCGGVSICNSAYVCVCLCEHVQLCPTHCAGVSRSPCNCARVCVCVCVAAICNFCLSAINFLRLLLHTQTKVHILRVCVNVFMYTSTNIAVRQATLPSTPCY